MLSTCQSGIRRGFSHCLGKHAASQAHPMQVIGMLLLKRLPVPKRLQAGQGQQASGPRWSVDSLGDDVAQAVLAPAGHMIYS